MLVRIIDSISTRWNYLMQKIWHYYLVSYLKSTRVHLEDHKSIKFNGRAYLLFDKNSSISIGSNFICNSGIRYAFDNYYCSKIIVAKNAVLKIGNSVGISNTLISCKESISIGNHTLIGGGSLIIDSNFHSLSWEDRKNPLLDKKNVKKSPVIIGDNVFIGTRSIICKGVTIGSRSIIAAGSVVVNNIPEDCIAGGNPCVVIKYLSDERKGI